jgi:hypothetical protein
LAVAVKIHLSLVSVIVIVALAGVSCKTARLVDTWGPKHNAGDSYGRLMIVGLGANPAARSRYENAFVDKLTNYGVVSVASINVVPELVNIDRDTVESWLTKYTLDGVIVTRITTTKPARHYVPPHVSLGGWYDAWGLESEIAPWEEKFFLETDPFDARTEELQYSAVLKTKIKGDLTKTIHAVIDLLAADMVKRGYFPGR